MTKKSDTHVSANTNVKRRKRYKIVNPVRFFIFILICSMVTIFTAYSIFGFARADAASFTKYVEVKIQEDDTLWNIVETYNPNADIDVRMALYDIYETNGIDAGSIHPGDVILVPVYE